MPSPKSWTVVIFDVDQTVQAVPTKWINGDNCLWPVLPKEKLNIALKNCEFNSCWPSHKVRILRNATYEDYTIARTKAKKAELTSDLNDTDSEHGTGKRKKKKQEIYSFSDSDSESPSEKPKRLNERKKSLKLPQLPKMPAWDEFNGNSEELGVIEDHPSYPEDMQETPRITHNKENARAKCNRSCVCCNDKKTSLYVITSLLVELNGKVDKIMNKESCKQATDQAQNGGILQKSNINFPIKTLDILKVFDEFIRQDNNYYLLVQYFSKMGGKTVTELVKRCLAPIMADELAIKYSYLGRKANENFSMLMLPKAVIDAAENACISKTQKETEQAISAWLKRASERIRRSHLNA